MSRLLTTAAVLLAFLAAVRPAWTDEPPPESAPNNGDERRAALIDALSETLSGAALVGRFSVSGRENDKPPSAERYELDSVTPLDDDYWMFVSRIKYGKYDVKVPLRLKVYWADDTPVISLTDFAIPGLGTFTARVMLYGDRYVGTWQHGQVGGHMWGHIETRQDVQQQPAPENGKGTPPDNQPAPAKGSP